MGRLSASSCTGDINSRKRSSFWPTRYVVIVLCVLTGDTVQITVPPCVIRVDTELLNASSTSSVCSSTCNSFASDEVDDFDASAGQKSSPPSTSDARPLNLTKRKNRASVTEPTAESNNSTSRVLSEPACSPNEGPARGPNESPSAECFSPSKPTSYRPSSFSLKTSPSKFLSCPADDQRRGGSKAARPVDGWSRVPLGSKAVRPVQPAYDNSHASMILSSSPSTLDRV